MAVPMCVSISIAFSTDLASMSVLVTRFSTANMMPSFVFTPMAVEPSWIALIAYSTYRRKHGPPGEERERERISSGGGGGAGSNRRQII